MRIYLAEGQSRTLVGRRPPTVSGPCDHLEFGSVTIVRPRPVPAGTPPVGFAIPRTAGWKIAGRSRDDYRVLTTTTDREDLRRAADSTVVALGHWPSLRAHVALDDPSPALARALWDLAGVLVERERVLTSWTKLVEVGHDVPADSAIRTEVAHRVDRAGERIARLTADVEARMRHLSRLADEAESFVRQQNALAEAREVLRDADYLMDTGDSTRLPADTGADLAEHTSAVLAAYQELTA